MAVLADTNVAARRVLVADPQHRLVKTALRRLRRRGEVVYVTAQTMIEFHALATRPVAANGLGMTAAQARIEARKIERIFPILPEHPDIYNRWRRLVDAYGVIGRQVFDTRLVAVMQTHGVTHILTMNPSDFRRFAGITVVEPTSVA
jgi:predicted nucleic acid-binding protein